MQKLIDRIKNILFHPQKEWDFIQYEHTSTREILIQYVLPLAGIAAIAVFIGYGVLGFDARFIKVKGFDTGLVLAINRFISDLSTILAGAYIIDALATSFGAEKNWEKSLQLVAYSYTPVMIGGILNILPFIAFVGTVFGFYGIALMYLGLVPMKKVPENKQIAYLISGIIILFLVNLLIGYFLNGLFKSPYPLP